MLDKLPSSESKPGEENLNPEIDGVFLVKDVLTIIRYAAHSRSPTKSEDLIQMVALAGIRNSSHPDIMDVLFEVYHPESLRTGIRVLSLLHEHPRMRNQLTPEEEALFANTRGLDTPFREWEILTQKLRNQKTEIEQIVDVFDNRLHLSEETKTVLADFIKSKLSPTITRIAKRLQQLTDNAENISDRDLQTIVWYIESYRRYQTRYSTSDPQSERDIAWDKDLMQLINWAANSPKDTELMDTLNLVYGTLLAQEIVRNHPDANVYPEKEPPATQLKVELPDVMREFPSTTIRIGRVEYELFESPPTITDIRIALQKARSEEN